MAKIKSKIEGEVIIHLLGKGVALETKDAIREAVTKLVKQEARKAFVAGMKREWDSKNHPAYKDYIKTR